LQPPRPVLAVLRSCAAVFAAPVAVAVAAATGIATVASLPPAADAELRVEARCRVLEALPLEPLGEFDGEAVMRARARCVAEGGPIAGAWVEADWIWAVERRALDAGTTVWVRPQGSVALAPHVATLRREPDGRWISAARGGVLAADGTAAPWAGRRWALVARLEDVAEPPAAGH
jgi:hypothetical protein